MAVVVVVAAGCAHAKPDRVPLLEPPQDNRTTVLIGGAPEVDSIALERSLCLGRCPAYRLRIARDGNIRFESRNPGDETRVEQGAASANVLPYLAGMSEGSGFYELPDTISNAGVLCPGHYVSDMPTNVVTIWGARPKKVVRYVGCGWSSNGSPPEWYQRQRHFENMIDSVSGAKQWIRPAARRR